MFLAKARIVTLIHLRKRDKKVKSARAKDVNAEKTRKPFGKSMITPRLPTFRAYI